MIEEGTLRSIINRSKNVFSVMLTEDNYLFLVVGDKGDVIKKMSGDEMIKVSYAGLFLNRRFIDKVKEVLQYIKPIDKKYWDLLMLFNLALERLDNALILE